MLMKSLSFEVTRCDNSDRVGKTACKGDGEINKYMRDFQVDFWTYMEKIDFSKYDEKPVFKIQELMSTILLSSNKDYTEYFVLSLRQH